LRPDGEVLLALRESNHHHEESESREGAHLEGFGGEECFKNPRDRRGAEREMQEREMKGEGVLRERGETPGYVCPGGCVNDDGTTGICQRQEASPLSIYTIPTIFISRMFHDRPGSSPVGGEARPTSREQTNCSPSASGARSIIATNPKVPKEGRLRCARAGS
jgi:hypothetical protein